MSNLSELFGIDDKSTSAFKSISAGIGAIADIAGAVTGVGGAIDAVLTLVNGAKDQLGPVLNAIGGLNEHQKAGDIQARLTNLNNVWATAQQIVDNLKASVDAGPALEIGDRIAQVGACRLAIDSLIGFDNTRVAGAFLAPFQDQIYYDDAGAFVYPNFEHTPPSNLPVEIDAGYGLQTPPPDPTGLVFSQLYVLPLFLYLETVFVTVGLALIPGFRDEYRAPISSDAAYLTKVHDTIRDGFRFRIPDQWDVPDLFLKAWIGGGRGISAVLDVFFRMSGARIDYGGLELYSGASVGAQYVIPLSEVSSQSPVADLATQFPPPVITELNSDPRLYMKFQLRAERRRRDLYRIVGLTEIWHAANQLRALIGEGPSPGPLADYSLRTFAQTLGDDAFDGTSNAYSVSRVHDFVTRTAPVDTDTRPSFVRSLRAALIN
jgi:hypothetical protein